jgi:predicted nuclease with TOPRIM domain
MSDSPLKVLLRSHLLEATINEDATTVILPTSTLERILTVSNSARVLFIGLDAQKRQHVLVEESTESLHPIVGEIKSLWTKPSRGVDSPWLISRSQSRHCMMGKLDL